LSFKELQNAHYVPEEPEDFIWKGGYPRLFKKLPEKIKPAFFAFMAENKNNIEQLSLFYPGIAWGSYPYKCLEIRVFIYSPSST
jgi:hypothetical protein